MSIFRKSVTDKEAKDKDPTRHILWKNRKHNENEEPVKNETKEHPSPSEKKMEEIYSTKDKHIRFKTEMPLEVEAKREKQEKRKEELKSGNVEFKLQADEVVSNVELKIESESGLNVANDVINDVGNFADIHSTHSGKNKKAALKTISEEKPAKLPKVAGTAKIVNIVPVYIHESRVNHVRIKAGRFSEIVENEYDQYLIYNDPTQSKRQQIQGDVPENKSLLYHLSQVAGRYKGESKNEDEKEKQRKEIEEEKDKKKKQAEEERRQKKILDEIEEDENNDYSRQVIQRRQRKRSKVSVVGKRGPGGFNFFAKIGRFFKVLLAMAASAFISKEKSVGNSTAELDYEERQDARYVMSQIRTNIVTVIVTAVMLGAVFAMLFVLEASQSLQNGDLFNDIASFGPYIYAAVSMILLIASAAVYRKQLLAGFFSLIRLKSNVDSTVVVAFIAAVIQGITVFISPSLFAEGKYHIYALLPVGAMLLNTIGRIFIEARTRENFRFITLKAPTYVAKIYGDEEVALRMISGTTTKKPNVVYHHKTQFLSDFLKISYAPDPSEEINGKLAPVVAVSSLLVSVIYFIITKDIIASLSSLTVMCCIGIPFSCMLAGNVPIYFFSRRSLNTNAMVNGFPCIRHFCDSTAMIVKAKDLYPMGCIKLESMRDMVGLGFDDILLNAGMVLREAESPLAQIFNERIRENRKRLPFVETVMYEDKMGIVGWVNGNRILIGNRALMDKYNIDVQNETAEERYSKRGQYVTYIASSGILAAQLMTSYKPNTFIEKDLLKAEQNGISFIISSTDPNLTSKKITDDYNLYSKSVKLLSIGYANTANALLHKKEETSRSYLATRGKFSSICKAVSGCIKLKSNLTLSLIVEMLSVILGIILCATMALYAGVVRLTVFNLLLYIVFWLVAVLVAGLIRRP